MYKSTLAGCVFAVGNTILSPVLASAQTVSDATYLEAITVTSSKRDSNQATLAGSVSIVSGRDLNSLVAAEDVVERVAGMQAAVSNGSQITFQIRGIGAVDHQALTPSAAAVYVDGVYQGTNVQTSALLFDMKRVEVLKGPQGTLFGRNASSGAINFVSVEPDADPSGYVEGELGAFERAGVKAAATLPMSDKLSLRVAGRYLREGPVLENRGGPADAGGRTDEFAVRTSASLRPESGGDLLLSLNYAEDNGVNPAPLNDALSLGAHEISIGADGIQDTDNEFYTASLRYRRDFGNVSLFSLSAFTGYNQNYGFDFDGTPAPFSVQSLNANLRYDRDLSQFSNETRLRVHGDKLDWLSGVYLESESFDQEYLIWCGDLNQETLLGTCRYVGAPGRVGPDPASPATATTLLSTIAQDRETAAIFSSAIFDLNQNLALEAGLRVTHERVSGAGRGQHIFDDGVTALNNRDGLGVATGRNEISDTYLSGRASLSYAHSDRLRGYLSYSNGYKSGGFNGEVINNATHFSDEGLFGSETVDALEAGVKYDGQKLNASVAIFHQWYDSPQARIFVPFTLADGGVFTSNSLSNLDKAISYGLEANLTWAATAHLNVMAGLVLNETEIMQESEPETPQNAETFNGNPLPVASDVSLTLGADYIRAISSTIDFEASGHVKYQSDFYLDAEGRNDRRQAGYTLVDVQTDFVFDNGVSVGLWARNVLDEDYATSGFGFIGYNTFRGTPRSYGGRLRYAF